MATCFDNNGNFIPCPPGGGGGGQVDLAATLNSAVSGPGVGSAAGQCPMQPDGTCLLNGQEIGCALIRECDNYTGAQHVNYELPSGPVTANANSWQVDPQGNLVYVDAKGNVVTPPQYAVPPTLSNGVFTSQYNPTQQAVLSKVNPAGWDYNPSSGWTPAAGSAPVETSPGSPAFTTPVATPKSATSQKSTPAGSTATGANANAGSVAGRAVSQPSGAPGTSGVVTPATAPGKSHAMLLVAAGIAIILLSRM